MTCIRGELQGMTLLGNELYMICNDYSKTIHVLSDQNPFERYEKSKEFAATKEVDYRFLVDITASKVNESIYTDTSSGSSWFIYKIKIPSRAVKQRQMDGTLCKLSTTSSDHILAVVLRGDPTYYYIDIYETSDTLRQTKSVVLSSAIKNLSNVVQNSEGNFIFAYQNKDSEVNVVSELSADGKKILRTFDPSVHDVGVKSWNPVHLLIDDNDDLFIAASYKKVVKEKQAFLQGVFFLNSRWNKFHVLLDQENNKIGQIRRIVLNEKKQLMIGHDQNYGNYNNPNYTVSLSVYNLY